MKKIIIAVLAFSLSAAFIACGKTWGTEIVGESFITEGWVNPDTFRVTSTGVPKPGLLNKVQKRGTAKEAALIMAQKRIIEKFVGARIKVAAGALNYASTGIAVAKEFGGIVRGGTILKSTYDKDDNCEIVYQLTSKGLKQRVVTVASK